MRDKDFDLKFNKSFDDLYHENERRHKNTSVVAHYIRERIQKGATVDQIASYKFKTLKDVLSFFRIVGRSDLNSKEDMAERLVRVLGSVEDDTGKRSSLYDKDEDYDYDEYIRNQNRVIHEIKKKGGI